MKYRFVTVWDIEAPLKTVCDVISCTANWPLWWHNVEKVEEIAPGDALGVGRVLRYTWRGRFPYRLTFDIRITHIEPLVVLEGIASGDLEGEGRWSFRANGTVTKVRYEWEVRTTRIWMNLLALFASPLIRWNHNFVMYRGGEALAHMLNARLVKIEHY